MLSLHEELPSVFHRSIHGKWVVSLTPVESPRPHRRQRAWSSRHLGCNQQMRIIVVYAAVNMAAIKLTRDTGGGRIIPGLAAALYVIALAMR